MSLPETADIVEIVQMDRFLMSRRKQESIGGRFRIAALAGVFKADIKIENGKATTYRMRVSLSSVVQVRGLRPVAQLRGGMAIGVRR